jgi:hypothetical protein
LPVPHATHRHKHIPSIMTHSKELCTYITCMIIIDSWMAHNWKFYKAVHTIWIGNYISTLPFG